MKHIQTLDTKNLCESAKNGGCGECQTSCQSACKTSCGIANQQCENAEQKKLNYNQPKPLGTIPPGGFLQYRRIKMIHCYKLAGLNIVLDVFSGSVHVVDDVATTLSVCMIIRQRKR